MSKNKLRKHSAPKIYRSQSAEDFECTLRNLRCDLHSAEIPQFIADIDCNTQNSDYTILDCNFNAGNRFFKLVEQLRKANKNHPQQAPLHYIAIDSKPLSLEQYHELFSQLEVSDSLKSIHKSFLEQYPCFVFSGVFRFKFLCKEQPNCSASLTLIFSSLSEALLELNCNSATSTNYILGEDKRPLDLATIDLQSLLDDEHSIDNELFRTFINIAGTNTSKYIYFSSSAEKSLLQTKLNELKVLSTDYSVNENRVRISAYLAEQIKNEISAIPLYFLKPQTTNVASNNNVAVIGAGMAGAQIANALARKGFQVDVYETSEIASGASGNAQGVVYTRPGSLNDPLNEFNFIAQQFADNFYTQQAHYENFGAQCGVLHLAMNEKKLRTLKNLYAQLPLNSMHFQWVESARSENICGVHTPFNGLLYSRSGWLSPSMLCKSLLEHENICVHTNSRVLKLERNNNRWQLFNSSHQTFGEYSICIIANAHDATHFEQSNHLPIKKIRGQVTHINCEGSSENLTRVVCGESYIAPPTPQNLSEKHSDTRIQSIGASFNIGEFNQDLQHSDQIANLSNANHMFGTELISEEQIKAPNSGRVGFRCTTLDYFPIVGAAPMAAKIRKEFAYLSKKANAEIHDCGQYYPGLYTFLGFGSRGLAYTPICAEILSDLIAGNTFPLRMTLYRYLHPARFLIRDLMRRKP